MQGANDDRPVAPSNQSSVENFAHLICSFARNTSYVSIYVAVVPNQERTPV